MIFTCTKKITDQIKKRTQLYKQLCKYGSLSVLVFGFYYIYNLLHSSMIFDKAPDKYITLHFGRNFLETNV